MKTITLLVSSLLLAACSAAYTPRYYYQSVEVANLSGGAISNLEVRVGERDLRCAEVAANAQCYQRFGKRPYPQQAIGVSWRDAGGNGRTQQINPMVPLTLTPALPLRVMLDIGEDGAVKAYFRQDGYKF
jgi:hypothetical protein